MILLSTMLYGQKPDNADTTSRTAAGKTTAKPAEFPGGAEAWRLYLEKSLRYPKKALRKSIQGLVRVQFLVAKDGSISDVSALNDPGGGLAEEAVRIIAEGPKWIPEEKDGKKVLYRHIQSITFLLE